MLLRRLLVTYISASVFWGLTGMACFGQTTGTIVGQVNDPISAAVIIAALPTLLIYLFGGRYFVRGLTAGAVK